MTEAIRDADEDSFAELIERHRRELHAHCFRMLGSVHDADDALQEALLGAWKGRSGFKGRSSLRSWLYTIATNASLRVLEGRRRRGLPVAPAPCTIHALRSPSRWPSRSGSSPIRTSCCARKTLARFGVAFAGSGLDLRRGGAPP